MASGSKPLLEQVQRCQPSFRSAVLADAAMAANQRGETGTPTSRLQAVRLVVRLALVTDAFGALVAYRAQVALLRRGHRVLSELAHRLAVVWGQVSIGRPVLVEPGVLLPHGQVVIDGFTTIASGARIRPFVVIGLAEGQIKGPTLAKDVKVGTGAKLIGPISVGAAAVIGANAVVIDDVPAGETVIGVPARPK